MITPPYGYQPPVGYDPTAWGLPTGNGFFNLYEPAAEGPNRSIISFGPENGWLSWSSLPTPIGAQGSDLIALMPKVIPSTMAQRMESLSS
jgi:hypothetical protein